MPQQGAQVLESWRSFERYDICTPDFVNFERTVVMAGGGGGWARTMECAAHPGRASTGTCPRCAKPLCSACTSYASLEVACTRCARNHGLRRGLVKALVGVLAVTAIGAGIVRGSRKLDAMAEANEVRTAAATAAKVEADRDADLAPMAAALSKEPCDRAAAGEYATTLLGRGKTRLALDTAQAFLTRCGNNAELGAIVYEGHRRLSEHDAAIEAASKLIAANPQQATYWVWRGMAYEEKGDLPNAVVDFGKALALEPAMSGIPFNLANDLEHLDRRCEAAAPLETWLAHNPDVRGADEVRIRVDLIDAEPKCIAAAGEYRAVIHFAPHANEMRANVTLNDKLHVRMVVDTGATKVSLSRRTAERLGLDVDRLPKVRLVTANGLAFAHTGKLDSIALGPLRLDHVAVVIPEDLGDDQLLLGQSFLSRFESKIDPAAGTMELSRKKRK